MQDVPAYERLAASLRAKVTSGELVEGARLPSELALANASGFSRSTVREALRTLEEAGYVERTSPRVMVVRHQARHGVSREMNRELRRGALTFRHLVEALLAMDPELSRLAATRAGRGDVGELTELLDQQARCLDDFDEWSQLDEEFHLVIAATAASPALATARASLTGVLVPATTRFVRSRVMTEASLEFHRRILLEIEAQEPDGAALMTRAHLNDFARTWSRQGHSLDEELSPRDTPDLAPA